MYNWGQSQAKTRPCVFAVWPCGVYAILCFFFCFVFVLAFLFFCFNCFLFSYAVIFFSFFGPTNNFPRAKGKGSSADIKFGEQKSEALHFVRSKRLEAIWDSVVWDELVDLVVCCWVGRLSGCLWASTDGTAGVEAFHNADPTLMWVPMST